MRWFSITDANVPTVYSKGIKHDLQITIFSVGGGACSRSAGCRDGARNESGGEHRSKRRVGRFTDHTDAASVEGSNKSERAGRDRSDGREGIRQQHGGFQSNRAQPQFCRDDSHRRWWSLGKYWFDCPILLHKHLYVARFTPPISSASSDQCSEVKLATLRPSVVPPCSSPIGNGDHVPR